ncbi:MAG: response regulator [Candidatus Marinimicrobia bacterium]|nr:response regulator [Candidatus Neomarinimicrobiota bacterium]
MTTTSPIRKIPILAVEDNPANMNYLMFILKKLNVVSVSAPTAEEALQLLKSYEFSCGLFDINLGSGMSGLELMEKVREIDIYKNIPIIAVTAYYGGGMHKKLIDKGFTDYLAKPYDMVQLDALLEKYIR